MKNIVIDFIAFIISAPIIVTVVMYYLILKVYGKKQKALHSTVNGTTILYIIAVNTLLFIIWGQTFYGWIILFLCLTFSLIIFIQWKIVAEVEISKAFKLLWRFSFLLFFFLYLFLMVVGLLQQLLYR